jgi:hypothetical protein
MILIRVNGLGSWADQFQGGMVLRYEPEGEGVLWQFHLLNFEHCLNRLHDTFNNNYRKLRAEKPI